ncbi:nucleotidase [Gordonia phage OneUp]|uniref:Nucleotidase n=1 Tax=Gordonia phage OneUp TaxID=1838074 RepID=A0A160DF07_9CAUD|nr:nucleotidase [Gordonia phage OneUp]ANA86461.1 nucleotidase [Gordonia phage OneUp]
MTEKKIRVGIDLDGVLYDFAKAVREYLVKEHSWDAQLCGEPQKWAFYNDWGLTSEGFNFICNTAADRKMLWDADFCTDYNAVTQIRRLENHPGLSLHVITARHHGWHPGVTQEATAEWLKGKFKYDTLTFSNDKTIVRTDYMIEDSAYNHLKLRDAGTSSFLLNQAWNSDTVCRPAFGGYPHPLHRIDSVKEFVDIVLLAADKEIPF